jgi:hypothetical protein
VACWIGRTPGQLTDNDPNFAQYRDQNAGGSDVNPDRWVVFHLHFNQRTQWLRNINGRTYLG